MKKRENVWFEKIFLSDPCPDIIPELMEWELKHGADINEQNESGETALYYALLNCDFDSVINTVEFLLKSGADPNLCGKNNESPLMVTISLKRESVTAGKIKEELVNLLLKYNANPNLQDKDGYTAIMLAILERNVGIVKSLLECKQKINIDLRNSNNISALDMTKNLTFSAPVRDHNDYYKALENYEKAIKINKQLETMLTEYMAGNYKKSEDLEDLRTDENKVEVPNTDLEDLPW